MVADAVLQQSATVLQSSYPAPVWTCSLSLRVSQSSSFFSGSTWSKISSAPNRDRDQTETFKKSSESKSNPEFYNSTWLALGFLIKEPSPSLLICYLLSLSSKSKSWDAQLVQNSKSAYLRSGVTDIFFFFLVEVVVRQ